MNEPLPDKTILLAILATILLIFILVFTSVRGNNSINNQLQWKDSLPTNNQNFKI